MTDQELMRVEADYQRFMQQSTNLKVGDLVAVSMNYQTLLTEVHRLRGMIAKKNKPNEGK